MIDSDLVSMLRCPATMQPLVFDSDAYSLNKLNEKISNGQLAQVSGPLPGPVEAVLRSADGRFIYPVSDGVLSLLPDSALVEGDAQAVATAQPRRENEIQRKQMEQYSEVYERWTGGEEGVTRALQRGLDARFRAPLTGASVLDIGNGGTPPETQLGPELAGVVDRFIALDKSADMLRRSGVFGDLILGDAVRLPFTSNAVDVVMVNNTIHHFGLSRGENSVEKLQAFIAEARRVARKSVIGVELLVPPLAESVERLVTRTLGFMPTFVYSAAFYRRAFAEIGVQVTDFAVEKQRRLTSPWRFIPPILDYTWLRVPSFLVPYSYLFFSIEK